jgi:hypothetical protein
LRTIVLREFGEAGLSSYRQFRACLLLLSEERIGAPRLLAQAREEEQMRRLKGAAT